MKLRINGEWQGLEAEAGWPLAYALRNRLDLTGTKLGCELEQCRACVVLADGHCTPSCVRTVADFRGRNIVTVEGLSREHPEEFARVIAAVCAEQAAQCGYCMPGMLVAMVGKLASTPEASEEELKAALESHICRCGSYGALLRTLSRLAAEKDDGTACQPG